MLHARATLLRLDSVGADVGAIVGGGGIGLGLGDVVEVALGVCVDVICLSYSPA